ncbi:hypothetical protein D1007_29073 [Hordeum vulgare]|nr:hypothetical protein D1007_29073 [Hordeum vulgare]
MKPVYRLSDEPVQLVSDLLQEDNGEWNQELLQRLFLRSDVEAIMNMPRPRIVANDFWAWAWDRSGIFSVKTAYRELKRRQTEMQGGPSNSAGDEEICKSLWKLKVQPKFRVFWWRVIKGFLPARAELVRRHIGEVATCALCGNEEETLFHTFVTCNQATQFWTETLRFFGVKLPRLYQATWTRDLLDPRFIAKEDATVIISVMWAIWGSRNNYTHGETMFQPLRSMEIIQEHIRSLYIPAKQHSSPKVMELWMRPEVGVIKINSDPAIDAMGGRAGTDVVARDHEGRFIVAKFSPYVGITDPYVSEALGCRDAMILAKERRWPFIQISTDCKTVVEDWNGGRDRSSWGPILERCPHISRVFRVSN